MYSQKTEWLICDPSKYFADYLRLCIAADFKTVDSDNHQNLRELLRTCGVHVSKGGNALNSDALFAVVRDEIPCSTTDLKDSGETSVTNANDV